MIRISRLFEIRLKWLLLHAVTEKSFMTLWCSKNSLKYWCARVSEETLRGLGVLKFSALIFSAFQSTSK